MISHYGVKPSKNQLRVKTTFDFAQSPMTHCINNKNHMSFQCTKSPIQQRDEEKEENIEESQQRKNEKKHINKCVHAYVRLLIEYQCEKHPKY